jgi:hypothetical protein
MMERSYSNCAYVTRPALCETKRASRTAIAVEFALRLECSLISFQLQFQFGLALNILEAL